MRVFAILIVPSLLVGCGSASAVRPDSSNPAHCIAAFSDARSLQDGMKNKDISYSLQWTARGIFEGKKLEAVGGLRSGQTEGEALLAAYSKDSEVMNKLVRECASRQDTDPTLTN